jgi:acetyl-CoA hydrolase
MSLTGIFTKAPRDVSLSTFVGLGRNADLIEAGRMDLIPCHMSDLPARLQSGPLKADVALVMVSPPDSDGICSLGLTSDYIFEAASSARVVLAEINEQVPRVAGDTGIPVERIGASIHSDRPLPRSERVRPSALEMRIAGYIGSHIRDGTCLQIGVGRLGEAVLDVAGGCRDLGVHAGMLGDGVLEMLDEGTINNSRKPVDVGLAVAGSVLGSDRAIALASKCRSLRLRSVSYLADSAVTAQLTDVLCVNSAIEVDLLGQVNSETAGGRYVGAVGGAVDFLRASSRAGGRSVVALPATAKGGQVSRVVPQVDTVSASRSDVDMIATEHGMAELRGVSEGERAARLIAIADPQHRDRLIAAAKEMGL